MTSSTEKDAMSSAILHGKIFEHHFLNTEDATGSFYYVQPVLSSKEDTNARCTSSLTSFSSKHPDVVTLRHNVMQVKPYLNCQSFSAPDLKHNGHTELQSLVATSHSAKCTKFDAAQQSNVKVQISRMRPNSFQSNCPYKDDNVSQILGDLFLGNIRAAYCEPLLCKLSIACVVDLSNLMPHQVPSSQKCICPCTCKLSVPHSRVKLRIDCSDSDLYSDIKRYSDDVNQFLDAALRNHRRVLIHCSDGESRSPLVLVQYLMLRLSMPLKEALYLVKHRWPRMEITPKLINVLCKVEIRKTKMAKYCAEHAIDALSMDKDIKCSSNPSVVLNKSPVQAWT